jgi:hypothetical protein
VLADDTLSWEARGLLAYLLSKPDNWQVLPKALIKESPNAGRDKVYRILDELKSAGYIMSEQIRGTNGQMGAMEYVVYDTPQAEEPQVSGDFTVTGNTVSGKTVYGNAVSGKHGRIVNTDSYQELNEPITEENNDSGESVTEIVVAEKPARKKRDYTPEFMRLWGIYPRQVNITASIDKYNQLLNDGVSYEEMLTAVTNYARVKASTSVQYLMHFTTFFGPHERWKDYLDGASGLLEAEQSERSESFGAIARFAMQDEGEPWNA